MRLRVSIYLERLCKDKKEFVTNPSSSILLVFLSLRLARTLSSNLFSLRWVESLLVLSPLIVSLKVWMDSLTVFLLMAFLCDGS